jgi:hypothetical protein
VRASRSVVETIALDITTIRRSAGRLESCLVTTPLAALEPTASDLVRESLVELGAVLRALAWTIASTLNAKAASAEPA